jgi:hypothetical protein
LYWLIGWFDEIPKGMQHDLIANVEESQSHCKTQQSPVPLSPGMTPSGLHLSISKLVKEKCTVFRKPGNGSSQQADI